MVITYGLRCEETISVRSKPIIYNIIIIKVPVIQFAQALTIIYSCPAHMFYFSISHKPTNINDTWKAETGVASRLIDNILRFPPV